MKYPLLAYHERRKWDALSKSEMDAMMSKCRSYEKALRKSGHFIAMEGLHPTWTATTVRVQNKVLISGGPLCPEASQSSPSRPRATSRC